MTSGPSLPKESNTPQVSRKTHFDPNRKRRGNLTRSPYHFLFRTEPDQIKVTAVRHHSRIRDTESGEVRNDKNVQMRGLPLSSKTVSGPSLSPFPSTHPPQLKAQSYPVQKVISSAFFAVIETLERMGSQNEATLFY